MKTNTFNLFLLSLGLIVVTIIIDDILNAANKWSFITSSLVAIPLLTAGVISFIGLINGIRNIRTKAHLMTWIGVIGNFLLACCFSVFLYFTYHFKPSNSRATYDPTLLIEGINANYDTLNYGEVYVITVRNDSRYFNLFGEQPFVKLYDHNFYPIPAVEQNIQVSTIDTNIAEGGIIEKTVPLKLKVKLSTHKDTVLTLDKTYYVTNFKLSPRSEGQLKNGLKDGLWRFWYDNDRKHLKEESYWKDGLLHGKMIMYWKNGNKWQIYNYQKSLRHGMFYNYDSGGRLSDSLLYANDKKVNLTER